MATQLLKNHQILPAILDLISSAKEYVVLITPYVKTWGHLERELKAAVDRDVEVDLFFRKDQKKLYAAALERFVGMGLGVFEVDLLHAKIYASEKEVIVSSMNLYEFSSQNSEEVAIKSDSNKLLDQVEDYINDLGEKKARNITGAVVGRKVLRGVGSMIKSAVTKVADAVSDTSPSSRGTCIRCQVAIELNPAKPLCQRCYGSWKKYSDDKYQENFCHSCGKPSRTSVSKPVCYECYKAGC